LCCCTAAAPWISRSACYHFRTASPLLALSVATGVVGAVDLVWMRRGRRARPLGWGARSVWGHPLSFFFACWCMVPAFCEDAGGTWEAAASGTLQHGLWGARAGPVPAIWAGTMALLGAVAGEGVERVVRSQSQQGRRRSVDLATVWLHYNGGIAAFDAGSTGRGTGGGWGVGERIGAAKGGRQAAPKAENTPFWGSAPHGIFLYWGHVTRPQTIFGWLF